jgi:hypothetical protein
MRSATIRAGTRIQSRVTQAVARSTGTGMTVAP